LPKDPVDGVLGPLTSPKEDQMPGSVITLESHTMQAGCGLSRKQTSPCNYKRTVEKAKP
jgi:hypothetical protein